MKKKYLLLTFLALAIVTSLTAGTLAIYTSTKDLENTTVTAKRFVFTAATTDGYQTSIKMAPTETKEYPFTVTNANDTSKAEVPLFYKVSANTSSLFTAMPGLKIDLVKDNETVIEGMTTGDLNYGGDAENATHFAAEVAGTHNYKLVLHWDSPLNGSQDGPQTTAGVYTNSASFKITVAATQDTTPQTDPFSVGTN